MIIRSLALAGGIAGATATSQFPEFSQQYMQRLGGAVDALGEVVADFDASAAASDLTRDEALAQMQGTAFLERRGADMARSIARYERLSEDLHILEGHGPFMRAYNAARFTDSEIAQAAWQVYKPAVPVSFVGFTFASVGFVLGGLGIGALLGLLRAPFRRRRAA
ncbi:DUF2937 family protein [Sulfitobacter donghicola]|uniref:Prolyl-tRNA synthetase n=1 Tax=Sulfitobacter donghicola DSW-25 = KCTC 12864 = JCM 14565 TaxID=1300350 RepID=A0A073IHW5_9RHOB|nr:DUF2937 family protein [Sulfitobacter donghicola]KEJ89933.1 prolyl-tRNA synthetase [Sulfitobacter donghicola DSW-25 = KCTC 12864 = JCM 14565]KIN66941.1 DUF2937 domain containing protein [Sulfitobacter donghicola DSW-25 = KCTC 12864 = JCM 14565]